MENKQAMELIWFLNDDIEYHREELDQFPLKVYHIVADKFIMEDLKFHLSNPNELLYMSKKRQKQVINSLAKRVMAHIEMTYQLLLKYKLIADEGDLAIKEYNNFRLLLELYKGGNTDIPLSLPDALEWYSTTIKKGGQNE